MRLCYAHLHLSIHLRNGLINKAFHFKHADSNQIWSISLIVASLSEIIEEITGVNDAWNWRLGYAIERYIPRTLIF